MELPECQDIQWISPMVIPVLTKSFVTEVTNKEESFEDYPCSNEPDDLLAEEFQKSDEAEKPKDTSELEYDVRDLSLIWEAPVRNLCLGYGLPFLSSS